MQNLLDDSSSTTRPEVDWSYIQEELQDVPEEYKEQRFYPLKHVVEIFSSGDPQALTTELRERESRLGDCVELVVDGYHADFARSIQNYSHILTLFHNSRQQVISLRRSVANATRQLSAQSRHMAQQYQRNMSLTASVGLLKDVQAVLQLPASIQAAAARKDWPAAVSLLLEACARLARTEMQQVGALRKLQADMGNMCRSMQMQMCEELLAMAYNQLQHSTSHTPGPGHHKHSSGRLQQWRARANDKAASSNQQPLAARTSYSGAGAVAHGEAWAGPVSTAQLVACLASLDGIGQAKAYLAFNARAQVHMLVWRAAEAAVQAATQSYHAVAGARENGTGAATGTGTGAGSAASSVPPHVEILAQKLVQGVADACLRALTSLIATLEDVAHAPYPQPSAALDLIREQLMGLDGSNPAAEAHFQRSKSTGPKAREKERAAREAYKRAEALYVWQLMQEEWHALLGPLLQSTLRPLGASSRRQQAAAGTAGNAVVALLTQPLGWLQKLDEFSEQVSSKVEAALGGEKEEQDAPAGVAKPSRPSTTGTASGAATGSTAAAAAGPAGLPGSRPGKSQLHFSLDMQGNGGAGSNAGSSLVAADMNGGQGYARLVAKAMGDRPGSAYLLPAIYLPLTSCVEAALGILRPVLGNVADAGTGAGASAGSTRRVDALADTQHLLRDCLEDYVLDNFLPQVWVDLRARCTTALEHLDAFRPPAQALLQAGGTADVHLQGGVTANVGRGVVPAARFAERLLQDVSSWSLAMPAFEASFMGVAENILGRVLDACWTTLMSLAGQYTSFKLALRYEVALAQAAEPDAWLLGPLACFVVPRTHGPGGVAQPLSSTYAPADLDVAAFMAATRATRPDVVHTQTGRSALASVAAYCYAAANAAITGASGQDALATLTTTASSPARPDGLGSPAQPGAPAEAGTGGYDAALELQLLTYQERPSSPDQLMSKGGTQWSRITAIAALAESLEFIAEAVVGLAARQLRGAQTGFRGKSYGNARGRGRHGQRGGTLQAFRGTGAQQVLDQLPDNIVHLIHKCKALSGLSCRALRLELQLQLAHTLHGLALVPHVLEPGDDAREAHPMVGMLSRAISRTADELSGVMHASRLAYVLSALPGTTATTAVWLLPSIREINNLGVERMVRGLSSLQSVLLSVIPSMPGSKADGGQEESLRAGMTYAFDRARAYYQLLGVPVEEVIRQATERPMRHGYGEWMALLQVHVPGRMVTEAQTSALQSVLSRAHGLTTGQKIAGAVGTVISTVITAPAERVADVALDVFKAGAEGIVAGAMIPARQIGKVLRNLKADKGNGPSSK